jgi:hypothetical protein
VAAGRVIPNAQAARAARVAANQIRRDARLIDKNVLCRVVQGLRLVPLASRGRDIRPTLFVGVYRFF